MQSNMVKMTTRSCAANRVTQFEVHLRVLQRMLGGNNHRETVSLRPERGRIRDHAIDNWGRFGPRVEPSSTLQLFHCGRGRSACKKWETRGGAAEVHEKPSRLHSGRRHEPTNLGQTRRRTVLMRNDTLMAVRSQVTCE